MRLPGGLRLGEGGPVLIPRLSPHGPATMLSGPGMETAAPRGWPAFAITLEARAPERNLWRRYRLTAGADLFGGWLVEIRFGRIPAEGRLRRRQAEDAADARRQARAILWRRASAPRRLDGVAYQVTAIDDPDGWARGIYPPPTLADLREAWLAVSPDSPAKAAGTWKAWFSGATLAGALRGRLRLIVPTAAARRALGRGHQATLDAAAERLGLAGVVVLAPPTVSKEAGRAA